MPLPPSLRRYHLVSDAELQSFYENRVGAAGPAYSSLTVAQRAEFRLFVETRGVLWNPRWGLVGRLNAYGALRNFTLTEQTPIQTSPPAEKETSASRAARINAKMARITAKADAEEKAEQAEQEELNRLHAAKLAGKGPRQPGSVSRTPSEEAAKAKILALQKAWAALTEAAGELRQTFPGDPKVPGSFGIKKKETDPTTGEKKWVVKIVHPLSSQKEKIIDQIQGILHPLIQAQAAQKIKQLPPDVAARIDPEMVADKVVVDWGNDARLTEKEIVDGKAPAHSSNIAGTYKTPGERREEEWFDRYEDAPANRPYCDIVRDVAARIGPVIGSMLNRIKTDPTFGSPEVDVTGERGEEDEPGKVTPVAEVPEEEKEESEELRKTRVPILKTIQKDLADTDPDAAALFGAMVGTPDEEAVAAKLGWDRRKFDSVKGRMQRRMRKYIANPRYAAAIRGMYESRREYRPLLRMVFPGLFIPVSDATYTTYRKFSSL